MNSRDRGSLLGILGGLLIAVFILALAVSCNNPQGSDGYYPHDTTHGYYDSHHHYHYYHKYGSGKKHSSGSGFSKSKTKR